MEGGSNYMAISNPNHSMILLLIYLSGQTGSFVTLTSCGAHSWIICLCLWHMGKPGDVSSPLWVPHWWCDPDSQHRGVEGLYGPPEQGHLNWNWNTNHDISKQGHPVIFTNNSLNRQGPTPERPLLFTGKHLSSSRKIQNASLIPPWQVKA